LADNGSAFQVVIANPCGSVTSSVATLTVTNCACLGIVHEQLQAVTNPPGQFVYTFDLQNNTGVPVKYLYLVPTTNCQTVTPDIITFSPPVPPGNTTNVTTTVTLSGACSSNRCFTFAAHTTNLTVCCSLLHCLPPAGRPTLAIAVAGGNLVLSWSDSFPDYVLECTPSLTPPVQWSPAGGTMMTANGRISVTLPITNSPRFYRLRKP
jgi:hypothetical protein